MQQSDRALDGGHEINCLGLGLKCSKSRTLGMGIERLVETCVKSTKLTHGGSSYGSLGAMVGELKFDLEIERTARRLHWETKQHTEKASTSYEDKRDIILEFKEFSGESEEEAIAIIPERTIKDMASPDLNQQPLCIEYPDLEGEDPYKHSKEFHVVCSGMRPQGITEEQVKLRVFPFSLVDQAKDWLYFLPSGSIMTWSDLKRQFLEKYFPASRATTIWKEISGIRQFSEESLFEYRGRFNKLVKSCPHHQIPDHLLIQYFYEGLSSMDRKLIDAVSGGAQFNKTPTEAHNLIFIMASNTQQFGTRYDDPPRKSNEVTFDDRLNKLNSLVKNIAIERNQHVKACGICTSPEHVTDMCPTLQALPAEHADAIRRFFG
ncbi:UNVERIFIED_CONTAM: hypothetical protein Scaly_2501800 [Sesamum calycinum]|uniref:Retrotransposon gag domain-containing protein n=1 Tax=Sesamum calycinum TaxID=2727403 RepID=A0AAW2LS73_9LAMI